jgi:hypothetical protein
VGNLLGLEPMFWIALAPLTSCSFLYALDVLGLRIDSRATKVPNASLNTKRGMAVQLSLCDFGIPRPTHRPVTVHFSDGTRIHIGIEPLLKVETKLDKSRTVI